MTAALILKRAPIGWNQNDFDVLEDGVLVGRIFFLDAVGPHGRPWMWTSGHNGDQRRAAYGYEPTREAAIALALASVVVLVAVAVVRSSLGGWLECVWSLSLKRVSCLGAKKNPAALGQRRGGEGWPLQDRRGAAKLQYVTPPYCMGRAALPETLVQLNFATV